MRSLIALFVTSLMASLPAQQLVRSTSVGGRWSQPATWQGGALPPPGTHVLIEPGAQVILDVAALELARLEVHGRLVVEDRRDYRLRISRVDVGGPVTGSWPVIRRGGSLVVGSAQAPFTHGFLLTLTDDYLSSAFCARAESDENLSFVVHGQSLLQLHGNPVGLTRTRTVRRRSWTTLSEGSAALPAGATALETAEPTGWQPGERLLVTGSGFDWRESEVRTIRSVQTVGGRDVVTFGSPLDFPHSRLRVEGAIDTMAEVASLSRNVRLTSEVVRSLPKTINTPVGKTIRQEVRAGHLFCHDGPDPDGNPVVALDHVEFTQLGWQGVRGRYPVHFHLLGQRPSSDHPWLHIRDCSVHHCFNRGIVLHGTDGIEVSRNVVFDTVGHGIYLEDHSERGNVLVGNLVLGTRVPPLPRDPAFRSPLDIGNPWKGFPGPVAGCMPPFRFDYFTVEDQEPANFWITNVDNVFEGNVAAGGDGHGYWVQPGKDLLPVEAPVMSFTRNTAHSQRLHGFFLEQSRYVPVDEAEPLGTAARYNVANEILGFRAYKNRFAGVWIRGYGRHQLIGCQLADNRVGAYFSASAVQGDGLVSWLNGYLAVPFRYSPFDAPVFSVMSLEQSLVVGESANRPEELPVPAQPAMERKGVTVYDGTVFLVLCDFRNFVTEKLSRPIRTAKSPGVNKRMAMAITSHLSHAHEAGYALSVDPRTTLVECRFDNCSHPILFPQPQREELLTFPGFPTGSTWFFANGSRVATLFDVDGSLPGVPPLSYLTSASPMLRPAGHPVDLELSAGPGVRYTAPAPLRGPGSAADHCIGQWSLLVGNTGTAGAPVDFIRVKRSASSGAGPSAAPLDVYDMFSNFNPLLRRFPTNLLLSQEPGAGDAEQTYEVEYFDRDNPGAPLPPVAPLRLNLQFGELGRSAVFRIPYGPTPPTQVEWFHQLFPSRRIPLVAAATKAAFDAGYQGSGNGIPTPMWWHDPAGTLYLRMVLQDGSAIDTSLAPAGTSILPFFTGRAMTVDVR